MISPETYRLQLSFGLYSRVAEKLALGKNGRSHVRRVATGERTSARVRRALRDEVRRIDRKVATFERQFLQEAA
jgi:hypothetical protein